MRFKDLSKLTTAAAISALLFTGLTAPVVQAEKVMKPVAVINGLEANGEVIIRKGNTFVTLRDLKLLGEYGLSYNTATKQITITSAGSKVILTAGSTALIHNGHPSTLSAAPFLHQGKTMIPLRAVTELFEGKVYWNAAAKTAYVNKLDPELQQALVSDDLTEARNAAINAPRISKLPQRPLIMTYMEMQGLNIYFPQGRADRFFEQDNDLLSYYEIVGDHAELKWQAKLDLPGKAAQHKNIYFTNAGFLKEIGEQPSSKDWTLAAFIFRYPIGATSYRFISSGKVDGDYGSVEHDTSSPDYKGIIVPIPGEDTLGVQN